MQKENKINLDELDDLKNKLNALYDLKKPIHVNIFSSRNKVNDALCDISGVYNKFFCVKSKVNNYMESFTINYIDIKIGNVKISELEN